jgi:hypothetical protein
MIGRSDILDASILIVDDLESNISLLDQILRTSAACSLSSGRASASPFIPPTALPENS